MTDRRAHAVRATALVGDTAAGRRANSIQGQALVEPDPQARAHALIAQVLLPVTVDSRAHSIQAQVLLPVAVDSFTNAVNVEVLSRIRYPFLAADGTHLQRKNEAGEWELVYHVYRP